jgi:hypothetical protein
MTLATMRFPGRWRRPDRDFWIAILALGACSLAGVSAARACSYPGLPAAFEGYPREGSTGVPTDVIPVFDRLRVGVDEEGRGAVFRLISERGQTIPIRLRLSHIFKFELVPGSRLEPNTRYTFEGRLTVPQRTPPTLQITLSFTTGSGPLRTTPPPPSARLEHYTLPEAGCVSTCDCPEHQGSCIALPATGSFVEFAFSHNEDFSIADEPFVGHQNRYLRDGVFSTNLTGIAQRTPDRCVRMRTRAENGIYSQPVVLCRENSVSYGVKGDLRIICTPAGLVTTDGRSAAAVASTSAPGAPLADGGAPVEKRDAAGDRGGRVDAGVAPDGAAAPAPGPPTTVPPVNSGPPGCSLATAHLPGATVWPAALFVLFACLRRRRSGTRAL